MSYLGAGYMPPTCRPPTEFVGPRGTETNLKNCGELAESSRHATGAFYQISPKVKRVNVRQQSAVSGAGHHV